MNFDYIKNKRILLVDDEPELLSMVETILKGEGYLQQKTAKTVKEAVSLWTVSYTHLDVYKRQP